MIPGIIAASVAAGWDPGDMTVPPYFWLDDTSVVASSGAASLWLDRSGNGVSFEQGSSGNRPAVIAGAVNGLQCLRFDGADDYLLSGGTAARDFARNKGYAWVLSVLRRRTGSSAGCVIGVNNDGGSPSARINMGLNYPAESDMYSTSSRTTATPEALLTASAVAPLSEWHMLLQEYDYAGNRIAIWSDGEMVSELTSAWASGGNTADAASGFALRIGSFPTGGNFLSADMAAQLGGHQTFATSDMDRLFGWAAWRYGLQGNLPSGHPYKDAPP